MWINKPIPPRAGRFPAEDNECRSDLAPPPSRIPYANEQVQRRLRRAGGPLWSEPMEQRMESSRRVFTRWCCPKPTASLTGSRMDPDLLLRSWKRPFHSLITLYVILIYQGEAHLLMLLGDIHRCRLVSVTLFHLFQSCLLYLYIAGDSYCVFYFYFSTSFRRWWESERFKLGCIK